MGQQVSAGCAIGYLVYGVVDVAEEFPLCVDGLWPVVLVVFQEQVFKRCHVLLFKRHHHLVAQTKKHQLGERRAKVMS